jgi:SsrA-binding protein
LTDSGFSFDEIKRFLSGRFGKSEYPQRFAISMSKPEPQKQIAHNRKARHNYEILETYEAGIALAGTEVKSLRDGRANFKDSYADVRSEEVWLHGMHISPYSHGNINNHDPERDRKLLLHRNEIRRLIGKTKETGLTLVPLQLYFKRGKVKVELGLAKGKKQYDKREAIAKRDTARETKRLFRARRMSI